MLVGTGSQTYLTDVHPQLFGLAGNEDNPVLGFAYAVGKTAKLAFGVPVALGALGGMVLLEGFLITTLDAAVRLTRYLFEEVWRMLFGKYDIFAHPVAATNQSRPDDNIDGEAGIVGGDGIPIAVQDPIPEPAFPIATTGPKRAIFQLMRHYWFNSGLAVAMMLLFALTGGQKALWGIFATSNQLLAAMVLSLASLWLFRNGKRIWFTFIPALLMLVTTVASLIQLLLKYIAELAKPAGQPVTSLLIADVLILAITIYLVIASLLAARQYWVKAKADAD
jgi:carbon starvation protein